MKIETSKVTLNEIKTINKTFMQTTGYFPVEPQLVYIFFCCLLFLLSCLAAFASCCLRLLCYFDCPGLTWLCFAALQMPFHSPSHSLSPAPLSPHSLSTQHLFPTTPAIFNLLLAFTSSLLKDCETIQFI